MTDMTSTLKKLGVMLVSNMFLCWFPSWRTYFSKGLKPRTRWTYLDLPSVQNLCLFTKKIPTLPKTNIAPETYFSDGLVQPPTRKVNTFRSSFWSYQELTELKASLRNHAAEQREASGSEVFLSRNTGDGRMGSTIRTESYHGKIGPLKIDRYSYIPWWWFGFLLFF